MPGKQQATNWSKRHHHRLRLLPKRTERNHRMLSKNKKRLCHDGCDGAASYRLGENLFLLTHLALLPSQAYILPTAPYGLFIAFEWPNRKSAHFFCRIGPNAVGDKSVAFKNYLENSLLIPRRRDHIMNMCRNRAVGIRRGFDRGKFIMAILVSAHVTTQPRISIIVGARRVQTFGVRVINVN